MAGPVAGVLMRQHISVREAFDLVVATGHTLGLPVQAPPPGDAQDVASLPLPNGTDFSIWLVPPDQEWDEEDADLIGQLAGYRPAAQLQVVSWTRDPGTARVQAEVLIGLAEASDALIKLEGAVAPPGFRSTFDLSSLETVRCYVAERPGVIIEVPYQLSIGGRWIFHLVDSHFLRAWLRDPEFYLMN